MDKIPFGQYDGSVAGPLLALMALGFTPSAKAAAFPFAPAVTGLLQGLEAKKSQLKAEGNAIITLATAAGGYTDEQREKQKAILADLQQVDADIELEKQAQTLLSVEPAKSILDPVGPAPEGRAPTPFASLGEQLQAVARAARNPHEPVDQRLVAVNRYAQEQARIQAAASGANEIVGSDGGFAVQLDFSTGLLDKVYSESTLASRTTPDELGPNSNGMKYKVLDETSRVDGSRWGGVQAYWTGEAAAITASRPKYADMELTLQKLTGMYVATDEELADAAWLNSRVERMFVQEFAFKLDNAIVRGTGAGMPQGILNANALVTVSKETNQAASTVNADNVEKMFARLWAPSARNAVWYINQDVWPQIFQLAHTVGTGGVPMFIPPAGLANAPFGTLLGRPIEPIEYCSTLGTVGDVIFADLSQYQTVRKGGIVPASSVHVYFSTDETAFRWVLRANGRPAWQSALTPFKGSNTLSPFVALQTR